jgi:hypothetical protein
MFINCAPDNIEELRDRRYFLVKLSTFSKENSVNQSSQSSEDVANYIEQTSNLINLPLYPDHLPGVVENFHQLQMIAQLFLDYSIPEDIEAAARFQP